MTKKEIKPAQVERVVTGIPTSEGAGVKVNRIMGTPTLNMLDPFLLLDEFQSEKAEDYIAGFPEHPHRGFETVTYMLDGRIRHKDNAGHEGVIEPGGVQWMTAGKGIIHSEMPEQEDGLMWGFQLWVNLPAAMKYSSPRYQEYNRDEIPREVREGNVIVKVIAGETDAGTTGPVEDIATHPTYFDIILPPDTLFKEPLTEANNSFIYVYAGTISVITNTQEEVDIHKGQLAVLGKGSQLNLQAATTGGKCLFLSAKPLNEPVVRAGPFVMNSREEIEQAVSDFQSHRL